MLLGVLGQQPELDVVAAPQLAAVELAAAGQRGDQRRLARAVGADERHVLGALEPQLGVLQQHAVADLQQPVLDLEHDAAGALGRLEGEAERPCRPSGRGPSRSILSSFFWRDWRLARAGARAEAVDEALELGDLGLLLLDRAPERQLALRLLGPPRVPGALEELRAARPRAPARTCRRPPGTSDRARPARRRRRAAAGAPPATPATRCRGGWWARRAAAGRVAGQRARQRGARELAAARTSPASGPGARRGTRARAASS